MREVNNDSDSDSTFDLRNRLILGLHLRTVPSDAWGKHIEI